MGKTYIDTLKYVIHADVKIGGLVEKPDVVGAIFGQTEGLLGEELDLRELQKNGRIGRIQVDLEEIKGDTIGSIKVPSSLDMVETCIVAGALETVDRVGPCDAKLAVTKIEDTRNIKRKHIIDRAKDLLRQLHDTEIPESKEITEMVRDEVKAGEISEYGPDRLPAGPNIESYDAIIYVEGRADVLNLLKRGTNNVVAIGGAAKVPRSIVDLSHKKEVTVFLDGDRGGDIILKQLLSEKTEIDFVARAPAGKEVEELARKESIKALRSKVPLEQYLANVDVMGLKMPAQDRDERDQRKGREGSRPEQKQYGRQERPERQGRPERSEQRPSREEQYAPRERERGPAREQAREPREPSARESASARQPPASTAATAAPASGKAMGYDDIMGLLNSLENTLKTQFYDADSNLVKDIPVRDMLKELEKTDNVKMVVFDGIVTQRLVDLSVQRGVEMIVGIKMGNVFKKPDTLRIITKP